MSFTVVILSKNANNLVSCVRALREHEPGCGIIWVDDRHKTFARSTEDDEHAEVSRAAGLPYINTVTGVRPFVYARNANIGIRISMGWPIEGHPRAVGAPFEGVFLLNDDALLRTPGGFTAMWEMSQQHPEYGVIASSCNNVGNVNQYQRPGGQLREDSMVCFIAVLIPRRTIETVGLLDERFIHYGWEDNDYCKRVRNAGLKVGLFDGCYVDHGSLKSSFRGSGHADIERNKAIYLEKWGSLA